jgi:tetratricopeptide (TPR) repeat protein
LLALLALGAIGFLPLFDGPGYEAALAAGLVLPSLTAVTTALEVSRARPEPLDALGRGVASGALLAALGLIVVLAHGLRAGFCDAEQGIALFALAAGGGAIMGGAWGAAAGLVAERVRRPRRRVLAAVALALLGPLAGALVSLWRFATSPMVFAFDPFFGYFAGPLYDTVIEPIPRLATYRLGSLSTLVAVSVLAWHAVRRDDGQLKLGWRGRPGVALIGALGALASAALTIAGPALGHYSTAGTIRAALGRSVSAKRCNVVYDTSILERDASLLARDCDGHLGQLERWFGARGPEHVTVYLFSSAQQKGALMGAAHTQIAKPWRREIYLQSMPYPHNVLGHELAHVVAGSFGAGPFRIAGPLGGLVPDPGRIEGLAVAATRTAEADLTLRQWARTLQKLDLLPPLRSIFRLSFLGENSSTAYTVAGAFVDWLHERYGAGVVRAWYGGAELGAKTGKDFAALEQTWLHELRGVEVSEQALLAARVRFDRPAIFGRRCPHVVDRLADEAGAELGALDFRSASEKFNELLDFDATHLGARLGLGTCALRAGNLAAARERFERVARDSLLPRLQRAAGDEAIADLELWQGNLASAASRYAAIERLVVDPDRLRGLEVKRTAADELARDAIVSLLIGDPRFGTSFELTAARLARWSALEPEQGTADYLLGRNLYTRGRWREAFDLLGRALGKRLDSSRVKQAALEQRLIVSCALGERAAAESAYAAWRALPSPSAADREDTALLAERCGVPEARAANSPPRP